MVYLAELLVTMTDRLKIIKIRETQNFFETWCRKVAITQE